MKIEHLCHLHFSEEQLKEMMIREVEFQANEHVPDSPEYNRLMDIVLAAQDPDSMIEDSPEGGLILVVNGVAYSEDL